MNTMPRSVGSIRQLIQTASESILPVESLDYDSLSYKPLSTWESRVSASPRASFIWTRIPANLRRLRGSTSPAKRILSQRFSSPFFSARDFMSHFYYPQLSTGRGFSQSSGFLSSATTVQASAQQTVQTIPRESLQGRILRQLGLPRKSA